MRTHMLRGSLVLVTFFVVAGGAAESSGRPEPRALDEPHRTQRTLGAVLGSEELKGSMSNFMDFDANKDGRISSGELTISLMSRSGASSRSRGPENIPENWEELSAELDSLIVKIAKLEEQYKDVLRRQASSRFYKVNEVAKEFIRIQHEQEERIIPFTSIREIKRTVDD